MPTIPQLDELLSGAGDLGDNTSLSFESGPKPAGISRQKRKILSNENSYWKKRNILYYVDSSLSSGKTAIKEALQVFENHTCFTFQEMSQQNASDVNFISGEG